MAQDGMDSYVLGLAGEGGFFVEAGANDGFRMSNTYLLERFHGWTGVLVEPIPALAAICARQRPGAQLFSCALVGPEDDGSRVEIQYADGHSAIGREINYDDWSIAARLGVERTYSVNVPGRTLTSVLDQANAPASFDLLSLDVEGFESQVLSGLDFTR